MQCTRAATVNFVFSKSTFSKVLRWYPSRFVYINQANLSKLNLLQESNFTMRGTPTFVTLKLILTFPLAGLRHEEVPAERKP